MKYIKPFQDSTMKDIGLVGGKNASLGQMISALSDQGVVIPQGFAITTQGYWHFIEQNHLEEPLKQALAPCADSHDAAALEKAGAHARSLILQGSMPHDLAEEIEHAYKDLSALYGSHACDVAVRSSATAEDLPQASFAGQQETFLNITGAQSLLKAVHQCIASLFTNRAIAYRQEQRIDHFAIAISVGVQKMVRSDLACAGVAFSLDTETGFKDAVVINSAWGLGEAVVQGLVTPDEFIVHKPTLEQGFSPIVKKKLGDKTIKMVYGESAVKQVAVPESDQRAFSLTDDEILALARMVVTIERYYSHLKKSWSPMDIEWAKDGLDGKIYIVQARPETIHAHEAPASFERYELQPQQALVVLALGQSIGQKIAHGKVKILRDVADLAQVEPGDILVTEMTDPDWVPAMRSVAGIVTSRGGRTCHAAIVSREFGIPAIVGASTALQVLTQGQEVTLDCSQGEAGYVYAGKVPYQKHQGSYQDLIKPPVPVMVNCADPGSAFTLQKLPVDGVGLARLEFIMSVLIKVHPMALVAPQAIKDPEITQALAALAAPYGDAPTFFVDTLAQGVGMIAAAFYPKPVVVRLSDFKSNEYRSLLGGVYFEPEEENPMLGFRGASRYIDEHYRHAFALECKALVKARCVMGLKNITLMVPFVRTRAQAEAVLGELALHGLKKGEDGLRIIMMCEIPSNVLLIDDFCQLFDGFSIGSNDLTQLTLGVDRDSGILAPLFDERDPAVMKMMQMAIEGAHRHAKPIGICGQAPSDYPEVAEFLIRCGIDSLSLNPDAILKFLAKKG